jgi:hypothetical protein
MTDSTDSADDGAPTDLNLGQPPDHPADGTRHAAHAGPKDTDQGGLLSELARLLSAPVRALPDVGALVQPAWRRLTEGESVWPVRGAVMVAIGLQVALPHRYAMPPRWLFPALGIAVSIALWVAHPHRITKHTPALRALSIGLIAVMSFSNAGSGARLIGSILRGHGGTDAGGLLLPGGAIWLTNVIVFALWYWDLDRGGPAARSKAMKPFPDFLFAQMTVDNVAPADWTPEFIDYLYLSFTNATAFSPTDTLPLARWAKLTMMLQSTVSLSLVVLVIARAVNILK